MEYFEEGRLEIEEKCNQTSGKKKKEKPVLKNGTIVFCRGNDGTGSFYGIVYKNGVLELECGSDAYISTNEHLHIGDRVSYWTIESVCKAKMIIEDYYTED